MAGIVGLTELQHTNGNSMLTVATTGDGNVKSEGGAATTSLRQGLVKAWALNNQSTTHSNHDSFNVSGVTDVKSGGTTESFTNNMANGNYSITHSSGYGSIDDASLYAVKYNAPATGIATGSISFTWYYGSHGTTSKQAADCTHIGMQVAGDLA